ncbi:MAG: hypothetical protein ACLQU1_21365 [Bryobacteraceae bacterium]
MRADRAVLFREKQSFHLGYARIALAMPPAALVIISCRQIIWHRPWGDPPTTNGGLLFLTALILLVYIRLITVRLVTELRPAQLSVAMKGLWRRTRVALADIRKAVAVEYDPVTEYRGYGVRSGPRGQAYIASGSQAVQLELRDGRKLLIGSQRPQELARRIAEAQRQLKLVSSSEALPPRRELPAG